MTATAPGVNITFTSAPPSVSGSAATGTWFVTGETAQGPTGVAVPITSMDDYVNYLGDRVSYGMLYDSLDAFFHTGGATAYVSRIVGPGASMASVSLEDTGTTPQLTLTIKASGAGVWGNNLSVTVAAGSATGSYTLTILNNGSAVLVSPNLFSPADAVTWFSAQNPWVSLVEVTNAGSTNTAPTNNPALGTFVLAGGTDNTAGVTETQWSDALTAFTTDLGVGQVSAPGHTTSAGYQALVAHAQTFNRVAFLDVQDSPTAATLVAQAAGVQSSVGDPSYGAMFAPWVNIPGITSTNPGASSPVPLRSVPPSAIAAGLVAINDKVSDPNTPAAGLAAGVASYAIGITNSYDPTDLTTLNSAGICVFRPFPGLSQVTLMGFRSLALDPNWVFLNNVRFRMEMVADFDAIGDQFLFAELDGRGRLIAQFNGALAGQCTIYYSRGSLFGSSATAAFTVNTGSLVNTPTSIAAGILNAKVSVRMSPLAEQVDIGITKYLASATFPASAA